MAPREMEYGAFMEKFTLQPLPSTTEKLPLNNLTFTVKDIFDVDGYVTGFGNPDWARTHSAATSTAPSVLALLAGGATCIGKTVMDEMAYSMPSTSTETPASSSRVSPKFGDQSEFHFGHCITTVKLNERNYLEWSQYALIGLTGQRVIDHVEGTVTIPPEGDPKHREWRADNAYVKGLILRSMEPEISKGFLFAVTVKELWDAVRDTYSSVGNFARLYELQQEIAQFKQENQSLSAYYHTLRAKWDEFDHCQDYLPTNSTNVKTFNAFVERTRIFQFLGGLHPQYENARVQVLGRYPAPTTIREVFKYIHTEESRMRAMNPKVELDVHLFERAALVSQQWNNPTYPPQSEQPDDKSLLRCTHCNRTRHTKETCWNLHGRPVKAYAKPKQASYQAPSRAHHAAAVAAPTLPPSPLVFLPGIDIDQLRRSRAQHDAYQNLGGSASTS